MIAGQYNAHNESMEPKYAAVWWGGREARLPFLFHVQGAGRRIRLRMKRAADPRRRGRGNESMELLLWNWRVCDKLLILCNYQHSIGAYPGRVPRPRSVSRQVSERGMHGGVAVIEVKTGELAASCRSRPC